MMVGIRSFPFEIVPFQGRTAVKLRGCKKTNSTQVTLLQFLDATHFARGQVRLRANGIRLKMDLFLFGIKGWKS